MSFLGRLFASTRAPARPTAPPSQLASAVSQLPRDGSKTDLGARREMLRVVLRDTLNRHGIPAAWITGETLLANSRDRHPGVHWRLVIKHWEPRLLTHGVALQNSLIKRVMTFDPMAAEWLTGVSWQFALADESQCPPMPHPGLWTANPPVQPAVTTPMVPGASGDVISGPVRIAGDGAAGDAATRADLEKLLAVRDADFKQHADAADAPGHDATQPMFLKTQPMQL